MIRRWTARGLLLASLLASFACKARRETSAALAESPASEAAPHRTGILSEPDELAALAMAADLAGKTFQGRLAADAKNRELDALIATRDRLERNALRFAIAKGQELAASAWVLPRAIAFVTDPQVSAKDYAALAAMGVAEGEAEAYLADVARYFGPSVEAMRSLGLVFLPKKGWTLAEPENVKDSLRTSRPLRLKKLGALAVSPRRLRG